MYPCLLSPEPSPKVIFVLPYTRRLLSYRIEDGDDSEDDDDLEVGGSTQDYKCPLTLTMLVDPMIS